jgi:hypothetical protein
MFFWQGHRVTPISPLGFLVAIGGSFLLLFFYRLLAGRFIREGDDLPRHGLRRVAGRRRDRVVAYDE